MLDEENTCQHCYQNLDDDEIVDLLEEVGDTEFHGHTCLCVDCFETLEDEFSDISHIIGDVSEEEFWETVNEDGPFGSPD